MSEILQVENPYIDAAFPVSHRARRAAWNILYLVLFRLSPRPAHNWRRFLLNCFGAKIAQSAHVYPTAVIWAPWNLHMDEYACLADDVICYSMATISLGKRAIVSQGTYLCTGSHDYTSANFQLFAKPIRIGEQAWVCAQSFIGPGVEVGAGAVVGARSVVTRTVPAWTVCAGNPCKPIKPRVFKNRL